MQDLLTVKNLCIRHYKRNGHVDALKDVSFSVKPGEFVSLCGVNGSGKTSLMMALNGLIPHFTNSKMKGEIIIDGWNTQEKSVSQLSTKIGFVFDNPFNQISYTTETVRHEIAFGLCNQNIPVREIEERIDEIADLIGIHHLMSKSPLELSGGQLQRVAIASTLVLKPKLLMLDDCTSQLDPAGAIKIFEIVEKIKSTGMTIISVDHNMERVCSFSDRILVLEDGKQIDFGSPAEVMANQSIYQHKIQKHDSLAMSELLVRHHQLPQTQITLTELLANLEKENACCS
ncbi:energy-coupling factor ABC transporter ATP-binding protein [Vibrio rhodolitus]|uniref:energy-coupling factor ABC transporter ATP-binding protein n=1 Tax=Vibrio rhodolitus TaxID=2231649 RepID=UPI000E0C7FCA|nr:ABC transporter ATP-binding protein [Vibrio rhodolitus]